MLRLLKALYNKIGRSYQLNSYNDFTIADYFRSQGARIGKDNRLEIRSLGPEPYLITIGNHCTVAPNVSFLTHDGAVWIFTEEIPDLQKFGPITICDNCFIGSSAIILPGITIGPNAVVGAGAVVTKDVAPGTIVAGNPAKVVSTVEKYREKVLKEWHRQKPQGYFQNDSSPGKCSPEQIHALKLRDYPLLKQHLMQLFFASR